MAKRTWKRIFWIFSTVICSFGLIKQIQHVSQRYFQYRTRTIVNMIVKEETRFPSTSICFHHHDIMNRSQIFSKYGMKLKKRNKKGYDSQEIYLQTRNFTIFEVFNLSPGNMSVLRNGIGCQIRYPKKYVTQSVNTSECYNFFTVTKYLIREHVCYLFKPRLQHETLSLHEYSLSPAYPGMIYKLFLDESVFNNILTASVSIHSHESTLIYDTLFSSANFLNSTHFPMTNVYHREFDRLLLEYPYDTKCSNPPFGHRSWYSYSLKLIDQDSRTLYNISIPFYPTFDSTLKIRKILNYRNFNNATLRDQINKLMNKNFQEKSGCHITYFITRSQFIPNSRPGYTIYWTQDEKTILRFAAEQELIDYVVYMCSCVGIWFGLSIYSLLDLTTKLCKDRKIQDDEVTCLKRDMFMITRSLILENRIIHRKLNSVRRINEQMYGLVRWRSNRSSSR